MPVVGNIKRNLSNVAGATRSIYHPSLTQPELLSASILVRPSESGALRRRVSQPRTADSGSSEETVTSGPNALPTAKHLRAPKRRRVNTTVGEASSSSGLVPIRGVLSCAVSKEAFLAASLLREVSETFAFCEPTAYGVNFVADFIIRALRNRARPLRTLEKVACKVGNFVIFANNRPSPFPISGKEPLIGVTLWFQELQARGERYHAWRDIRCGFSGNP